MFLKRLGHKLVCQNTVGCPDIFQLENGDFAIIGADITDLAAPLPPDAGCAPHERIVRIPRERLINAKRDIPDAL